MASDFGVQFLFAPQEARQWTDPDPDRVAAGKRLMNLIESWGLERNTLAAVLVTKNPMLAYMSYEQASAELGVSVAGVIPPAAEALETAYRLGAPLLVAEPESIPADSLQLLAQRLTAPVFAMA